MNESRLGQKLKDLRKLNNYPQEYVASSLGIIRQTYSHYETGKRIPSPEMLYKLSLLYGISVDSLMLLTTQIDENIYYDAPDVSEDAENVSAFLEFFNNPANQKKYKYNTKLEKELLYYFQKLSDIDRKEIIEFTKIKAKKKRV